MSTVKEISLNFQKVNADTFYANFTNTTCKKIPIPHLTRTMKQFFFTNSDFT